MMKRQTAVHAFASLAHDVRLGIFQYLVEAGPEGLAAGQIADKLKISPSNLTFHIAHLERAGLVHSRREGRSILYSADFAAMEALVDYLTDKCCGGHPEVCRRPGRVKRQVS